MILTRFSIICFILAVSGCTTVQIPMKGNLISEEKNIWIEDPVYAELNYCISNVQGSKADPVCFPARRGKAVERLEVGSPSSTSK
jgi:hypothetical protein